MACDESGPPCMVTEARRAISLARALSKEGIRVFGADVERPPLGLRLAWFDGVTIYPRSARPQETVDSLIAALRNTGSRVIMSISTLTARLLVSNAGRFQGIADFLLPDEQAFETAYDRLSSVEAARRLGVPAPPTRPFNSPEDADHFPLVSKPRYEKGGATGVSIIRSKSEAEEAFRDGARFGPLILQEYIPGTSRQMRTCDLLFDAESSLKAAFAMTKIREYPSTGGVTLAGASLWDPDLVDLGERLLSSISWRGVAEVEFKVDPRDGEPKLMEINPRFWAYLWLPVACGVNFPHLLYRLCLGEELEPVTTYRTGVGYINAGLRPASSLASFLHVPKRAGLVVDHLPPRDPTLAELLLKAARSRTRPARSPGRRRP